MRLKDINYVTTTSQPIRLHYPNGDSNIATLDTFEKYKAYKIVNLWCKNNELNIELKEPESGEYAYLNIMEYLLKNYSEQIIDLYCKGRNLNLDSYNDLVCVLEDNDINLDILNEYKNNM